ncbi:MAG: acyl-CoA dehydrogenase family protein [Candidatus Thorarchaeota archaeon]|jgi:alkylation response protein AidB-like acyl-CoA dehydrogenase/acyl dehydratase/putative sterol carrier protein
MTVINDEEMLYKADELQFRKKVRDWVEAEISPLVDLIERDDFDYRAYFKKLGDFGLSGLLVPGKYGGSEKPFMYQLIAGEEISAVCPAATMMFGASCTLSAIPILRFGTEEQKEKYLKPLATGEKIGALAITEPKVGSDTAGMETSAVWDNDRLCWVLNGQKRYITNGSIADQIVVFAITDPNVDSRSGMSAFIMETSWEGFSVVQDFGLMGREGVRASHLKFDNLKVPKENLLGKLNQGFLVLMDELDSERIGIAAEGLGCMRTPFRIAVEYSQEREQFDRPISRFEGVSFKIADMATKMRASRLLLVTAARMYEKSHPCTKEATMAKLYATEASIEICDLAIQVCGGAGYVKDYYPLERFYRDARLGTIGGGTSEIMRFLIQREVYVEHKRGKAAKQATPEVETIDFDLMMAAIPNGFRPERAEGVAAEIKFAFTDADPWLLKIEDQQCSIEKTESNAPAMTVETDSATWRSILLGSLDAMQAMMAEKVSIDTDDMDLLMKFVRMFRFTPELLRDVQPRQESIEISPAAEKSRFTLGKSLDEITIGETAQGKMVVTDEDIAMYAKMSGDYNLLHTDDEYAATTMFGRRIAHGPIAGALVARVVGTKLPGLGTLAFNMKVNFKAPVYPDDEITATVEVTEKVVENNLLRMSFSVVNQDDIEVLNGYTNVMPPIKE